MTHRQSLVAAVALVSLAPLAACGGGPKEEQQFTEAPVEQLYNYAADLLDERRWTEAAVTFQEVERQHPYSAWARRSLLMAAYAQYQAGQYDEAESSARQFIALHPGNDAAPYAYYLIAISHFEQILDVGRDQKRTEQALDALQEIVRRYPESDYARDARLKIDLAHDQLAGKEMEVGRFYLKRGQELAAVNRFKRVVEEADFQRTSHVPEALHRLVEAYLSLGLLEEARKAAAILSHNYPGDPWYQRSYDLLVETGLSGPDAPAPPQPLGARGPAVPTATPAQAPPAL